MNEPLLLTPKEAAKAMKISERTLRTLKATGQIPFVRIRAAVRFDPADLRAWIERQKIPISAGAPA
jgi:excisionase family DNA binding protein